LVSGHHRAINDSRWEVLKDYTSTAPHDLQNIVTHFISMGLGSKSVKEAELARLFLIYR
jgi:hypothetical protein